jgi:hypothetical protein
VIRLRRGALRNAAQVPDRDGDCREVREDFPRTREVAADCLEVLFRRLERCADGDDEPAVSVEQGPDCGDLADPRRLAAAARVELGGLSAV